MCSIVLDTVRNTNQNCQKYRLVTRLQPQLFRFEPIMPPMIVIIMLLPALMHQLRQTVQHITIILTQLQKSLLSCTEHLRSLQYFPLHDPIQNTGLLSGVWTQGIYVARAARTHLYHISRTYHAKTGIDHHMPKYTGNKLLAYRFLGPTVVIDLHVPSDLAVAGQVTICCRELITIRLRSSCVSQALTGNGSWRLLAPETHQDVLAITGS